MLVILKTGVARPHVAGLPSWVCPWYPNNAALSPTLCGPPSLSRRPPDHLQLVPSAAGPLLDSPRELCRPPPAERQRFVRTTPTLPTTRMSSGERPIGAAKGNQSDTEALCQPPPPTTSGGRPCPGWAHG